MYPYESKLLKWFDKVDGWMSWLPYTVVRWCLKRSLEKHGGMFDGAEKLWFFIWDHIVSKGFLSSEQRSALCKLVEQYPTYEEEE